MTGSVSGDLILAPNVEQHVLSNLQLELAIHVNNQNTTDHSIFYPLCTEELQMREIKGLASVVREHVAQLRANAAQATKNFTTEVTNTNENISKLNSVTAEMKVANKEVESILNDVGTNFPEVKPVDVNGVLANKGK